jgi:hypothetical protein
LGVDSAEASGILEFSVKSDLSPPAGFEYVTEFEGAKIFRKRKL